MNAAVDFPVTIVRRCTAKIDRVTKVSTMRKLAIAGQIVSRRLIQSRTAGAALSGARTTAKTFGRVGHQLWLEVTGFTFLVLALIGGIAGLREYAIYQSGEIPGLGRVILAECFAATFAWFGVSSFWRVRKKK
jgi:hypothetical protein